MKENDNQEIDLLQLTARLYRAVTKNWIAAIILPLAGAIIAISITSVLLNTVESSMLIKTDLLSKEECEFLFRELEETDTFPLLTEEEMEKVSNLNCEVIERPVNVTADIKDQITVYTKITAKVHNQDILPALEAAIVAYLNQNESTVKNRKAREKINKEIIKKIDEEGPAWEAIQQKQVSGNVNATYLAPSDFLNASADRYKKRIQAEIDLENIKSVWVVKGFDSLTRKSKLTGVLSGAIGFLAGIFGFFLLLFILFFRGYLKNMDQAV